MSGVGEGIAAGVILQVLQTCYVYGRKWLENYRRAGEFKVQDAEEMEHTINKLLNIKEFYLAYWVQVPGRERLILARYLGRIHNLLCDNPLAQESLVTVVGTETFHALTPADVYQQLGQYTAELERSGASIASEEDRNYVERLWDTAKKEVSKVKERVAFSVVGRDRTKKVLRIVEEWIGKIDDLIGYRATLILLKHITSPRTFTEHMQRLDLPNMRNQIGLLLTNSTTLPLNIQDDTDLNPSVTVFARRAVTCMKPFDTSPPSATSSSSFVNSTFSASGTRTNSRCWAKFAPGPMSDSPTSVIIEFKPVPVTDNPHNDEEIRTAILRQVRSLIKALRIGAREPSKFHVMDCLGLFEDLDALGIIFKPPYEDRNRFRCQTLNAIIENDSHDRFLSRSFGNRIALATALSWSLVRFHLATWVHKKISTHNILLFQDMEADDGDGYSWDSPFLVGFELARHSLANSNPQQQRPMEWKQRIYTHPQRVGNDRHQTFVKFTKRHDIYSLGVVLLEIGLLHLFTAPRFVNNSDPSKNLDKLSPSALARHFQRMARSLRMNMGSLYAEATLRCLEGDFHVNEVEDDSEDTLLTERFIVQVCEVLESIRI